MYRLFSLIALFLLVLPLTGRAAAGNCGPNVISNAPQCIAKAVFEGRDADMPVGPQYQIAIQPIRDKRGNIVVPATIPDALDLMREMLPHWYVNALLKSQGDNECDVIVDKRSFASLVATWLWVHWGMSKHDSVLRQQFSRLGLEHDEDVEQALIFGFCEYVKNGKKKAMETIQARASWKESQQP